MRPGPGRSSDDPNIERPYRTRTFFERATDQRSSSSAEPATAGTTIEEKIMNRSTRWQSGLATLAVTAGLLLTGAGTAAADSGSDPTTAPRSQTALCTHRIPAVLDRIERLTDRINGDAQTRGSTAWLQAKSEQARSAGFTALADLLDSRVQARPERLDELDALKGDVQGVLATDCAS
jgi:hypothetical protein